MNEEQAKRLLEIARIVVKEFEVSSDAGAPTPSLWPSLELLREHVAAIDGGVK